MHHLNTGYLPVYSHYKQVLMIVRAIDAMLVLEVIAQHCNGYGVTNVGNSRIGYIVGRTRERVNGMVHLLWQLDWIRIEVLDDERLRQRQRYIYLSPNLYHVHADLVETVRATFAQKPRFVITGEISDQQQDSNNRIKQDIQSRLKEDTNQQDPRSGLDSATGESSDHYNRADGKDKSAEKPKNRRSRNNTRGSAKNNGSAIPTPPLPPSPLAASAGDAPKTVNFALPFDDLEWERRVTQIKATAYELKETVIRELIYNNSPEAADRALSELQANYNRGTPIGSHAGWLRKMIVYFRPESYQPPCADQPAVDQQPAVPAAVSDSPHVNGVYHDWVLH